MSVNRAKAQLAHYGLPVRGKLEPGVDGAPAGDAGRWPAGNAAGQAVIKIETFKDRVPRGGARAQRHSGPGAG